MDISKKEGACLKTPRLEIDLNKIQHNTQVISRYLSQRCISLMGITKVMLGDPEVARVMVKGGAKWIGDSRIENIQRMHGAGVKAQFVLIRSPLLSQVNEVISYAQMSLNSEISIIRALSEACQRQNTTHDIVIMIELGDLREGILPSDLHGLIREVLTLKGIKIAGIGTNMGCFSGVAPVQEKMDVLSELAHNLESIFHIKLPLVSGGNSSNFSWLSTTKNIGRTNNLRMGEMIFLGHNILTYEPEKKLYQDTVSLVGEVIEFKFKNAAPKDQKIVRDAFGEVPKFQGQGMMGRAILGLGRQDVLVSGLKPMADVEVIGACSDHMILDTRGQDVQVGEEFRFSLSYGALLSAMTSPFVKKVYLNTDPR